MFAFGVRSGGVSICTRRKRRDRTHPSKGKKKKKRIFRPPLSVYRLLPLRFFFCPPPQLLFCNRNKGERKELHVSRSLALSKWPFSDPA
ncbi:hypothetical protein GW17_00011502 [Ensete ventricosum]|nr:hypothetical protein GW17_00011502 [Ensete ventricosum]